MWSSSVGDVTSEKALDFLKRRKGKGENMRRFSRPRATGGSGFARYDYQWSKIGLRISTKRIAVGALKALYGSRAASAAIRLAQKLSGKRR
jgi:hypothetical protein